MRVARALLCAAAFAWMAPLEAQWQEGFESYADGSALDGQGGWHGWDGNDSTDARVASQFASEGAQCVQLSGGADSVREFDGIDAGRWTVTTQVYAPSSFAGRAYFLLLNFYQDLGPYQWSVQLAFDGDTRELLAYLGSGTPVVAPLVVDSWVELRCEVDLDNDLVEVHYDDVLLGGYPWSVGPFGGGSFGLLQIDAVDLYSDSASYPHVTELYFDDLHIRPFQGPVGTGFCYGDGSGAICPCGNVGALGEGCRHSAGSGAILDAVGSPVVPADDILFHGAQLPPLKSTILFTGPETLNGGMGNLFGDGLLCAGGAIKRLALAFSDSSGDVSFGPGLGAEGGWIAGDTRRFQIWYRDPQGSPCGGGFNLTNGLEIVFVP